jgi:hypothetical protein
MNGPVLIVIGTLLFAVGGIVATYGWNVTSRSIQRETMVMQLARALAAESVFNMNVLHDPVITLKGVTEVSVPVRYPRLRTLSLHAALSSGIFLNERPGDKMYGLLGNTIEHIEEMNRILSTREDVMQTQFVSKEEIAVSRKALAASPALQKITNEIFSFGNHVYETYGLPKDRDWTQ